MLLNLSAEAAQGRCAEKVCFDPGGRDKLNLRDRNVKAL